MEKQTNKLAKARIDAVLYELKHTYSDFIYPLSKLKWEERTENGNGCLSTDGMIIYYEPELVLRVHKESLKHEILHIILHGLMGHFQIKDDYPEKVYRDIIMDVQVAYMMDRLQIPFEQRQNRVERFGKLFNNDFSMGQYYKMSQNKELIANLDYYRRCSKVDDHAIWEKDIRKKEQLVLFWKDIQIVVLGEEGEREALAAKLIAFETGSQNKEVTFEINKTGTQNYGELLEELFRVREINREEPDSIDTMLYSYGLDLYEDVPLIEPIEICEKPVFHTLALAIDVSGSCTIDSVMKSFWGETYECIRQLKERHAEGEIILFQCDDRIQKEQRLELAAFTEEPLEVEIIGMGGTCFIPVFERLEQLQQEGIMVDALIYLTDGCGMYPEKEPDYPVYFVLTQEDEELNMWGYSIPDWIHKVCLNRQNGEV